MLVRRSARKASPTTMDRGPLSPKGWMKLETDGVGLAIVADLEKAQPGPSKPSVALRSRPAFTSGDLRVAEFLRRCYLCRERLHGKDIYMYRGEKAFCSMECRSQQIASDEHTEKHRSRVLRHANVSSSSHCDRSHGRLFFTGAVLA